MNESFEAARLVALSTVPAQRLVALLGARFGRNLLSAVFVRGRARVSHPKEKENIGTRARTLMAGSVEKGE